MANEERPSLLAISTAIRASMVRSNTGNKINTVDQGQELEGESNDPSWLWASDSRRHWITRTLTSGSTGNGLPPATVLVYQW